IFMTQAGEGEAKLPYYFAGVGCHWVQEPIHRPIGHPCFQWIQCRQGEGELTVGERVCRIGEGQGMLLFPNEPHCYHSVSGEWIVDWIIFSGEGIEPFFQKTMEVSGTEIYRISKPERLAGRLETLLQTASNGHGAMSALCSEQIYAFLLELMRLISHEDEANMDERLRRLSPAFAYVERHCAEPISLGELSASVGMTPQYFCSLFRRVTGQTPLAFINGAKIRRAKEALLANRGQTVAQVAASVGFSDVSYFCALFRRNEGMTPTQFRSFYGS
ncbi:MAG: helix-turn-helix transcriptional regulator, partial [Clostridia bacterium]|nr:helix-turn-helix transcriptional regulator [Clostridia bacterium]